MRLRHVVLALLLFSGDEALSQRYPFINYTPLDGLVSNRVRSMYQDSKGRLYFLTNVGLSVYDGARFTNYTTADGLAQELVNDIIEITPDSFWVATNISKLNCLVHQKIETVRTTDGFYPVINKFFRANDGRLYVAADDGLFVWQQSRFFKLPIVYDNEQAGYFIDIKQVGKYFLLFVNPGLGPDPGDVFLYDPVEQKTLYRYNEARTFHLATSPSGDVWISGSDGIKLLKKGDLERGIFRKEHLPPGFSVIENKTAASINFDKLGRVWLSVSAEGVLLIDPGRPTIQYTEASGLASDRVNSIFEDNEGNHWLLPEGSGAQKLVNTNITFFSRPFGESAICDLFAERGSDSLWMTQAYSNILILVTPPTKKIFDLKTRPSSLAKIVVHGDSAFVFDQTSLKRFELPKKGATAKLICQYDYTLAEPSAAMLDPNGNVIFCLGSTLRVFFKDCSTFMYPMNYFVDRVDIDRNGVVWAITRSGQLLTFSLHPKDPSHYLQLQSDLSSQLKIENPRSLVVDEDARVWIGTRFMGIYCYKFQNNRLQLLYHIGKAERLTDNFINYLECNHQTVWASSPGGLDKLYTVNGKVIVENITQSNKVFASLKKIVFNKSGNVWAMGEPGNVIQIGDERSQITSHAPQFFLSSIKAGDQTYADAKANHVFPFQENNIIFYAAAPSFFDEKKIQYSYRLDGSGNSKWSEPVADAAFHFVNLAPGKYVLHVKAEFPAGRYVPQLIDYPFVVSPPWWGTWWARSLMALLLVSIIIGVIRRYYRSKLLKQKILLEKQQAIEKERTRIATDMHDDLGSGLSRIKYLSQSIQLKKVDDMAILNELRKIASYSDEMVEKMGEIVWALNEKNDTLEHLVTFTRAYAADYLGTNNIHCIFKAPSAMSASFVTGELRRNVFLSVKETLHNVVKHAKAQTVTIVVSIDSHLKFNIHDDGKGIDWNQIRPFSNGLSNIQKRMEEVGGKAVFHNNGGTEVVLDVPLEK